jgi:nucleotide-binding universal stress UspA family protein
MGRLVAWPNELAEAGSYLEELAPRVRTPGLVVETHAAVGPPALVVADLARERGASAVAMATQGRGGVARAVLGSVATGVLHRATVPVLLARPVAMHRFTMLSTGERPGATGART